MFKAHRLCASLNSRLESNKEEEEEEGGTLSATIERPPFETRNRAPLGPYSGTMPRALCQS